MYTNFDESALNYGLLTVSMVNAFTGVDLSGCDLPCTSDLVEEELLKCFGESFTKVMFSEGAIKDYSGQKPWNNEDTFPAGCVVSCSGELWIVTQNAKCIKPGTNKDYYIKPTIFDTSTPCGKCYEFLWCTYLGKYLSYCFILDNLAQIHAHIDGDGILVRGTERREPADPRAYNALVSSYKQKIARLYGLIKKYVRKYPDCFKGSKFTSETCISCTCTLQDCTCTDQCEEDKIVSSDYEIA